MDFELVGAGKPQLAASDQDVLNVTHNWWGVANEAEVGQRIFDLDDWNSLSRADFSPFYTSEELFINFWWDLSRAQLSYAPTTNTNPSAHDLRGRLWGDLKLELDPERWCVQHGCWDLEGMERRGRGNDPSTDLNGFDAFAFAGIHSRTTTDHFVRIESPAI